MKRLVFFLAVSTALWSCNDQVEYENGPFEEVEVGLVFDKFIPNVSVSPMALSNARSAAAGWVHVISEEMATVTIVGQNPSGEQENLILHKEFNQLDQLTFTLKVGCTYTVTIVPDDYTKMSTGNMIFEGQSDQFVASAETGNVLINCTTPQALVLISDEYLSATVSPKVEFYTSPDLTELIASYGLGKEGSYYAMYITDMDLTYRFVIEKENGESANVKLYNVEAGKLWTITANSEASSGLDLDIDGAFEETPVNI